MTNRQIGLIIWVAAIGGYLLSWVKRPPTVCEEWTYELPTLFTTAGCPGGTISIEKYVTQDFAVCHCPK